MLLKRFKAWAFREPVNGPCYSPEVVITPKTRELRLAYSIGKVRKALRGRFRDPITKDTIEAGKFDVMIYGRRKSVRTMDYLLKSGHLNPAWAPRPVGYMSPAMIGAVGISVGLF